MMQGSSEEKCLGMSGSAAETCIARALAVEAGGALMDEPTSALDPISTSKMRISFRAERKDTIIIVLTICSRLQDLGSLPAFFLLEIWGI